MIKFTHLGVEYEMTEQQIEAAYRYQQHQYRKQDAKHQLDEFIYGCDPDELSNGDKEYQEFDFIERYGFEPRKAYMIIDKIIQRFEKNDSCDVDENSQWQNAIYEILTGN